MGVIKHGLPVLSFYFIGKFTLTTYTVLFLHRCSIESGEHGKNLVGGRYIDESWPGHVPGPAGGGPVATGACCLF